MLVLLEEECRLGPLKGDDPPDPENEDRELEAWDEREKLEDLDDDRDELDDREDDREELDDLEEWELELCLDGGILNHLFF